LRIAAGETLPLSQNAVSFSGHAIEARLYAEDPYDGFLPRSGRLLDWRPPSGAGVRVDHGIERDQIISPFYDAMLAKIIAHGTSREEARRRLAAALQATLVLGVETNRTFLLSLLQAPAFIAGAANTGFIARHFAPGSAALARPV